MIGVTRNDKRRIEAERPRVDVREKNSDAGDRKVLEGFGHV